jgi:hypothetical protein
MSDRPNIFIFTAPYCFALRFLAGVQEASQFMRRQQLWECAACRGQLENVIFLHPHIVLDGRCEQGEKKQSKFPYPM